MSGLPIDISSAPTQPPVRPMICFPQRHYGTGRPRAFNPTWYTNYSWLEYSIKKDVAFCYACRFFGLGNKDDAFVLAGFRDWKHALGTYGIITKHDSSSFHKAAMSSWGAYVVNSTRGTSVANQLDKTRQELIKSNRHYIIALAEILLLCAQQDIALRGHRESPESINRGNFLEILQVVASHDKLIEEKLRSCARNAIYTSPQIQNTMLETMGDIVRNRICSEVRNAVMFSVLVDETKDISKQEQLAIVLRYVDVATASIFERFLTFVKAENLNAESLTKYILDTFEYYRLDISGLVSQGYDGASVMSGKISGVQARIQRFVPSAVYIHCNAHCLNLCLVDSVKAVSYAGEFFALLESLYVFLSSSKCHVMFIHHQQSIYSDKQVRQLQRLLDIRWACRANAVATICCTYQAVLATLKEFIDGDNDKTRVCEARGLLLHVRSFQFIVGLVVFDRILSCTKGLSDALQCNNLDLAKAANLVSATIETVQQFRSDGEWEKLFTYVDRIVKQYNLSVEPDHIS